jgi:hypothetical protein
VKQIHPADLLLVAMAVNMLCALLLLLLLLLL